MSSSKLGRNRSFLRLWFAQGVDEMGTNVAVIALTAVVVLAFHGGALPVGIMFAFSFTTLPIAGLVAGSLVTRYSPRRLMQATFVVRGAALATFPVAALLHLISTGAVHGVTGESAACNSWSCSFAPTFLWVYIVVAAESACNAIFTVAWESVLPRLVERDQIGTANSRLATTSALGMVAGPGAGGLAAQLLGPATTLWGNVGAFVLSIFALNGVKFRDIPGMITDSDDEEPPPKIKRGEVWALLRRNRILRRTILTRAVSNLGGGMFEGNFLVFLFGTGLSAGTIGLVLGVGQVGAFLGAFVTGRVARVMSVGMRLVLVPIVVGGAEFFIPFSTSTHPAACDQAVTRGHGAGSINYPDAEAEPMVAADPRNQQHLIANYQQDRWNDGGANVINTLVSNDGGKTWTPSQDRPGFSICAGATSGTPGYYDRTSDPWVSIGPDGVAYQSAMAFNMGGPALGGASSVLGSSSGDGGSHWTQPTTLFTDPSPLHLNDKPAITADPLLPGHAYAVWDNEQFASEKSYNDDPNSMRGPAMFSMTQDGGATWTYGRPIYDPGERAQTFDNQILVVPSGPERGALINGFLLIKCGPHVAGNPNPESECTFSPATVVSHDGGSTWSEPRVVATMNHALVHITALAQDKVIRSGDIFPQFSVNPTSGVMYAAWQDSKLTTSGVVKIALSRSADNGGHWSAPVHIDKSPGDTPAFIPQIRVAADGIIGITYYDLRDATATDPGRANLFLIQCQPATNDCGNPTAWAETKVTSAGSFDITAADDANGYFLGDYEGLAASGRTWVNLYVVSGQKTTAGATDVMASTVGMGGQQMTSAATPVRLPDTPFSSTIVLLVIFCVFMASMANTVFDITSITVRQAATPDRLLGPTMSMSFFLMMSTAALGSLIGGIIGSKVSPGASIMVCGVIIVLAGLLAIGRRLGTVESYHSPHLENLGMMLDRRIARAPVASATLGKRGAGPGLLSRTLQVDEVPATPAVAGASQEAACTVSGCANRDLHPCAYVDRRGRACATLWCPTHSVSGDDHYLCRRHERLMVGLGLTLDQREELPPIDNFAASLAIWVGKDLDERLRQQLTQRFPEGAGISVVTSRILHDAGAGGLRWACRWWVTIGALNVVVPVSVSVDESNDKFVVLAVNGRDAARGSAPWITRRQAAQTFDPQADAEDRERFYNALLAPVFGALNKVLRK